MITRFARTISIFGNPVLLMPVAVAISVNSIGDHTAQLLSVIIAICLSVFVFIYSLVKVRTGQWKHVDASMKHERKEINIIASSVFIFGALGLFLFKVYSGIVLAVGISGVIVLLCHLFNKLAKPSLHLAFALFATCLVFPNGNAAALFLLFAFFVGWSRIHLGRHTRIDLAIGAGIGFVSGVCFQFMIH